MKLLIPTDRDEEERRRSRISLFLQLRLVFFRLTRSSFLRMPPILPSNSQLHSVPEIRANYFEWPVDCCNWRCPYYGGEERGDSCNSWWSRRLLELRSAFIRCSNGLRCGISSWIRSTSWLNDWPTAHPDRLFVFPLEAPVRLIYCIETRWMRWCSDLMENSWIVMTCGMWVSWLTALDRYTMTITAKSSGWLFVKWFVFRCYFLPPSVLLLFQKRGDKNLRSVVVNSSSARLN